LHYDPRVALSLNLSTVVVPGLTPAAISFLMRATHRPAVPGLYLAYPLVT